MRWRLVSIAVSHRDLRQQRNQRPTFVGRGLRRSERKGVLPAETEGKRKSKRPLLIEATKQVSLSTWVDSSSRSGNLTAKRKTTPQTIEASKVLRPDKKVDGCAVIVATSKVAAFDNVYRSIDLPLDRNLRESESSPVSIAPISSTVPVSQNR